MSTMSLKRAAIINFISKYSNIIVQLIISSVLARILTPDDYGVVAIINVFISFFAIIADMGIGPAIIQNKDLNEDDISNIFNFSIFTSIILGGAFYLFSYLIAKFYSNNVYISLGHLLSIAVIFNVLNIVPNALLMKEKRFKLVGIRNIIITILGGILTIILALNGFNYYALIIQSIFTSIITFIANFCSSHLKIKLRYDKTSISKIKTYSSFQFGFSLINYFSRNLDNLLTGKFLGAVALGYYDKAYKLMLYPVQNLTYVLSPVLHPVLADYQNDRDYIYQQYIKVVRFLSLLGIFFGVFCFFGAKEIILIMFGEKWIESIGAFRILSVSIWAQVVTSSTGSIFQATGETKKLFKCGLITTFINLICLILGLLMKKIEFVAIGITVSYCFSFIVAFKLLIIDVFKKSLSDLIKIISTHAVIGGIMILALLFINVSINNSFLSLIIKGIIAVIAYFVGMALTKEIGFLTKLLRKEKTMAIDQAI